MKKRVLRELGKIYSSVPVENVEKAVENKADKPKKTRKKKEEV